ncbi:MAG: hypothetical protein ACYC3X_16310 [Pirellulaceae bacterium]
MNRTLFASVRGRCLFIRSRVFVAQRCLARRLVVVALLALAALACPGCGRSEPAADPQPMQVAIEQYLRENDMALRIKAIEQGPTISGTQATMSVSLTHAELGGPSVVWVFQFEQDPNGGWRATSHHE